MTRNPRSPSCTEFSRSLILKFMDVLRQEPFEEYQSQVYTIVDDSSESEVFGVFALSQ